MTTPTDTNEKPEIAELFKDVRRGATDLLTGTDKLDVGRGVVTASLLLIAASDDEYRLQMVARSYSLVTKRTDENKNEVDGARVYFRDLFVGTNAFAERLKQTDEEDRITRERHNNKVQALDASAMFAAYCIITIDHAKVWQSLAPSKKRGGIKMSTQGASVLWPSKSKTLDEMDEKTITISNRAGAWRMSVLESMGREIALQKGLRVKPAGKATPIRDAADAARNSIEANDTKVLNTSVENRLALFSLAISVIDALNDKTFVDHVGNDVVAPFRARVMELHAKAEAERTAKITPKAA